MKVYGIDVPVRNVPALDAAFVPIGAFNRAFLRTADKPVGVAVERADGQTASVKTFLHGTPERAAADRCYLDRLVKTILWTKGGFRIYVSENEAAYRWLKEAYAPGGARAFDRGFMEDVYERPFEVVWADELPPEKDAPQRLGGHLDGCRIGFDAGGSDHKVSALIEGECVYDEEVVWFPKEQTDPQYHYDGIVAALKSAAAHLPRVDAVGVSSAGVYINNRTMVASLFNKVPRAQFEARVKDIYLRAVRDTFGDVPCAVVNDGDVSALAGRMSIGEANVLGIAMGTSEAAGYVDAEGRITGWLNELAFVPVDVAPDAPPDEWSGDVGCGVKYFSQDGVIKLAPRAGIELDAKLSPAEKLKAVQRLVEEGSPAAERVYDSVGTCLGHTLAFYHGLYGMRHVLLLGRVMSGRGGERILAEARRVLSDEYPAVAAQVALQLPDERFRRLGQSAAASSLPNIE